MAGLRTALLALVVVVALLAASTNPAVATGRDSSLSWSSLSLPTHPPGLVGGVAAYDPSTSSVVLFGGRLADGQLSDQTWIWNGSSWSAPTLYGSSPAPRQLASMAFDQYLDPPEMVLFGGRGADGVLLDDTWTWNGSSWNQVATADSPGARAGAAMTVDRDHHVVLFGGYGITTLSAPAAVPPPTTTTTAPTTTTVPPTTTTTTSVPPVTTTLPPVTTTTSVPTPTDGADASVAAGATRAAAQLASVALAPATDPASGGTETPPEVLDDTWVLWQTSSGTDQWQQIATPVHPPATTDAALAAGPQDVTVLFGGTGNEPGDDQNAGASAQTWVWNGTTWSHPLLHTGPPARQDATLVFDARIGATVLFGGLGPSATLADTWLWNGRSWQRVSPATPPVGRSGGAAAYDPRTQQLLAFGGSSGAGATLAATEVLSNELPSQVLTSPTTAAGGGGSGGASPSGAPSGGAASAGSSAISPSDKAGATAHRTYIEHRGAVVDLSGAGFLPHAKVVITFHSKATFLANALANAHGVFHATVEVPITAAIGDHHFVATGQGPHGLTTLLTPVRVVALTSAHETSTATKLALVAIALAIPAVSWGALGALGRRRRRRPTLA